MRHLFISTLSFMFILGCRTVPEDAPEEFFAAEAAIEKMDAVDGERIFPNTASYAEKRFDQSLEMLASARKSAKDYTIEEAIETANEARVHAEAVTEIQGTFKTWDQNPSTFKDALAFLDAKDSGTIGVAVIETQSPLAKLSGTEITATLAYFDTDKYSNPKIAAAEMASLVEILKRVPDYNVTLIGSTDPRGGDKYNQVLAMSRAKEIAGRLYKAGIAKNRIAMKTLEVNQRFTEENSPLPKMQLDRRVMARLRLE